MLKLCLEFTEAAGSRKSGVDKLHTTIKLAQEVNTTDTHNDSFPNR